jgi:transitional endoplasmic reticulum ATPase
MNQDDFLANVEALKEALRISPDNIPLRKIYVDNLLKAGREDDALEELKTLLKAEPGNLEFKYLMAVVYYHRLEITKAIVLIEDIVKTPEPREDFIVLYLKLLIEEKSWNKASKIYAVLKERNPGFYDETIEKIAKQYFDNSFSVIDQANTILVENKIGLAVEKPKIKFDDVGGMSQVKEEIAFKIIRPLQHMKLFAAYGKKAGGGILLYGPPGCGKTYIARATAGETGSCFISIGIHDILNKFIGESENRLHAVFDYARSNTPAVLFFDEADALGASRTDMKENAGRFVINEFLMEMDGDKYSNEGVLILAATNAPWHLDPAFKRPGRFDRIVFVPPPDTDARNAILHLMLKDKPTEAIDFEELAQKTQGFSGADLGKIIDIAVEEILREVMHSNEEIPVTMKQLLKAVKSVKPSTREWFATAKNYTVYANEGGFYDDIARYLNM